MDYENTMQEALMSRVEGLIWGVASQLLLAALFLFPAVMLALYWTTGNAIFILLLMPGITVNLALLASVTALLRRSWTLYMNLTGRKDFNPAAKTRGLLLRPNLIVFAYTIAMAGYGGSESMTQLQETGRAVQYSLVTGLLFGTAVYALIAANSHKPKFED